MVVDMIPSVQNAALPVLMAFAIGQHEEAMAGTQHLASA